MTAVDYQTALNRWARAQAEAATGIPAAEMEGDCTLDIHHQPAYAWSSYTWDSARTEAELRVPLGEHRGSHGSEWTRVWDFNNDDRFDFAEILAGIIDAANTQEASR